MHVLYRGRIVRSPAGRELAPELEEKGYDWIIERSRTPLKTLG